MQAGVSASLGETNVTVRTFPKPFTLSAYLIGFGLGGFFDGILLHQILQWHHLLSLVDGVGDIHNQVLFDGLFHAVMYVIAAVGLVLLTRSRQNFDLPKANTWFLATSLLGFGIWHVLDSFLSHWILGIHRIRIDSDDPLFWDLLWFALFAIGPIAAGLLLRKKAGPPGQRKKGAPTVAAISALVIAAGLWAAQPPENANTGIAVFRPGMTDGAILNAIMASNGQLLWESRGIWAVKWQEADHSTALYGKGALIVSNGLVGAGCLAWARA